MTQIVALEKVREDEWTVDGADVWREAQEIKNLAGVFASFFGCYYALSSICLLPN